MRRYRFLALILVVVMMLTVVGCNGGNQTPPASTADKGADFPTKPIEWIVHSSAGGGSDIAARTTAIPIQEILGKNLVVANHTGGDGAVQMDYLQKQPADGHTWALMTGAQFATMLRGNVNYKLDDWTPVINLQIDPRWLVKRGNDDRFKNINDVIAYAKANPGKLSIAGMGFGTDYMVINTFQEQENIEINYVPFDSTGDATIAVLGEHADLLMGSIVSFVDYVKVGDIDPLLIFFEERAKRFPDVPAAGSDLGHKATYLSTIRGIYVKAGTPDEVVKKIHETVYQAMQTEHYKKYEESTLQDIVPGYRSSADYVKLSQEYWNIFERMLKKLGEI